MFSPETAFQLETAPLDGRVALRIATEKDK